MHTITLICTSYNIRDIAPAQTVRQTARIRLPRFTPSCKKVYLIILLGIIIAINPAHPNRV